MQRRRRTRDEWRRLIAEYLSSGLARREFAERAGVNAKTLDWYRRAFRKEEAATTAATGPFIEVDVGVAVPVAEAPSPPPPLVVVDASVRVEVPTDFDQNTLARVLDVLEARR